MAFSRQADKLAGSRLVRQGKNNIPLTFCHLVTVWLDDLVSTNQPPHHTSLVANSRGIFRLMRAVSVVRSVPRSPWS